MPDGRWPVWLWALVLYPFAFGAAAVNLFFLTLITQTVAWRAFTPIESIWGGVVLGVPGAWIAAKWIRGMINEAEDQS